MKVSIWDGREFEFDAIENEEDLKTMSKDELLDLRKDVIDARDEFEDMDDRGLVLDEVEAMINNELLDRERTKGWLDNMKAKQSWANIKKFDDYQGRIGFAIAESVSEYDNSYEDMGMGLDLLIDKYPDKTNLIEEVVIALSGYSFETLRKKMREQKEYYDSL